MMTEDVIEAFTALMQAVKEAAERMQEMIEAVKREAEKQPIQRERLIPPRHSNSRVRSPFLRRYWINYRARDKLASNSLKSGGKGKCQRK